MPSTPFAPFRIRPGDPLPETENHAARTLGAPLVVDPAEPAAPRFAPTALGRIAAGSAADRQEACRDAGGQVSGTAGHERACLQGAAHRARVVAGCRALLDAGYAGALLDRPDLVLGLGLLGAGFCDACQEAFQADLRREYGDQVEPFDFRRIAADELASAPGAVSFRRLHFGRDFLRFRLDSLSDAVAAYALPVRDAARAARRPFTLVGRFEQAGPAQFQAARFLDGAVLPLSPLPHHTGGAEARLWRAAIGTRRVAAQLPAGATAGQVALHAAALAATGDGGTRGGERAEALTPIRALLSETRPGGRSSVRDPVAECLVSTPPRPTCRRPACTGSSSRRSAISSLTSTSSRTWPPEAAAPLRPSPVLVLPQPIG